MGQTTPRRDFIRRFAAAPLLAVAYPAMVSHGISGLADAERSMMINELRQTDANPLLGAWVAPGDLAALESFERSLGRHVDIVHSYQGWGAENSVFDAGRMTAVAGRGSCPLITWEPWDYRAGREQPRFMLSRIADGAFDAYARSWAVALKRANTPLLLRFAHEMNGTAYPWSIGVNGNQPRDYVAAWRHLVDLFRDEGATNVSWVWCPQAPSALAAPLEDCFPGDDYVDVVGMDGYNAGTAADWGGWLSFTEIFGPLHEQVKRLSRRPVIIAETGCAEEGGSKAQWIADAFLRELPDRFADIDTVVWFNERREADWRLNSSASALATARMVFRTF